MKKITLLCIAFVVCSFTWQLNAQSVASQLFTATGTDSNNFQLSIDASDITANEGQPIQSVTILNYESRYNSPTGTQPCVLDYVWFYFDLSVTGGTSDGVSVTDGCEDDFIDLNVSDFTNLTFTSVDADGYSDTVYLFVTLEVTYETPDCPAPTALTSANVTTTSTDLSWTESGTATLYDFELVDVTAGESQTGTPTAAGITSPYSLSDLTPAHNYQFFVRADCGGGSTSSWAGPSSFLTLALPPENTTCADATLLACEQTVNGTTVGSTATAEGSGCSMGDNGVWFTFKGTGGDITVASTASFDHEMSISKGACGALTNIACKDGSTGVETYTIALTTLDQDYYVYLARYNSGSTVTGTYSITLTCATPPACTQAIVGSSTIVNDCAASQFSVDIDITSLGNAVAISNGTDTYPITGTGIVTAGPFDFGTSQTLTVVHDDVACNLALGSFNVSACPPANDDCSNAVVLTAGADLTCATPVSGSTVGATQSLPGCVGTANDDVWYSFVATGAQNSIIITNTGGSADIVTEVFDACGGTSLKCQDTPNSPVNLTGLTSGSTYYFRVYTYSSSATTTTNFDVCVGTPPPPPANDECSGAELLTVEGNIADLASATQIPGTISSATDSGVADQAGTANDDVWYSFVATSTQINIDVTDDFDGVVELFSGSCGALTSIEYDDYGGPSSNPSISRSDFVEGDTYYVRVYNYSSSTTSTPDFTIALWTSSTLSVDNFTNDGFTYFPNPVKNALNLKAQSTIQNVSIYNMLGQEVAKTTPNTLNSEVDMSALQTGAYFVKVTINDATETIRVIKQ